MSFQAAEEKGGLSEVAVAVLWVNFGHYHLARLAALNEVLKVRGIELAPFQRHYGWKVSREALAGVITTLSEGAYEDQRTLALCVGVWRALSREKPRIVLVPGYSAGPPITAAVWCWAHGAKAVLLSESTFADYPRQAWREWLKRCLVRTLFTFALVGGKRTRDYVRTLGIPSSRTFRYYDVVDNEYFAAGTAALRRTQDAEKYRLPRNYFLFVGRLAPEKNVVTLIDAFAHYRSGGGDWELVLVGEGTLRKELTSAAQQSGQAATVHFAGFQNGDELLPYYAFAGCLILPSTREPWGLVVNEAMTSGLPVLVSRNCGCSEDLVVEGENGFAFDPHDRGQLAALMAEMASSGCGARALLGMRSRQIIAEYSPGAFASEVRRLLQLEDIDT